MSDVIDTTAEEIGAELVPTQPAPANLFRTDDPVEVIERATRVAGALKSVIDKQKLTTRIQGKEHVRVEGWQTCGAMLGVVPVVEWTRQVEGGWEARCEARTLNGQIIGAGEAMCTKSEGKPWSQRPDYALRSMAQTRATSKALSGPLRFIMTLAGYEATPAEEMPSDAAHGDDSARVASVKQLNYLKNLFKRHQCTAADIRAMLRGAGVECADDANPVPLVEALSGEQASTVIDFLTSGDPLPDPGATDVPGAEPGEFEHPVESGAGQFDVGPS